jgi:hypothetical protein
VTDVAAAPRKRKRFAGGVRRTLELFLLAVSLIVGVGVIGGCGAVLAVATENKLGYLVPVGGALLVGVVYLATSMSRDVRIIKQRMLEQQQLDARHDAAPRV